MHEKANTSGKAHSPEARKRVCTRKPTRQSRRIRLRRRKCMHEIANTFVEAHSPEARANTSDRTHSLQTKKRVCTRMPTRQVTRTRLRRGNVYAREN